jgi:hypothetical protein
MFLLRRANTLASAIDAGFVRAIYGRSPSAIRVAGLYAVCPCGVAACLLRCANRATAAGDPTGAAAPAKAAGDPTRAAAPAKAAGNPTRSAARAAASAALPDSSRSGRAAIRAAAGGSESGWGRADHQDESNR